MKPTLDSIVAAYRHAQFLARQSEAAMIQLAEASTAIRCTSPKQAREKLSASRASLNTLRRTQTAALANIDAALKSL